MEEGENLPCVNLDLSKKTRAEKEKKETQILKKELQASMYVWSMLATLYPQPGYWLGGGSRSLPQTRRKLLTHFCRLRIPNSSSFFLPLLLHVLHLAPSDDYMQQPDRFFSQSQRLKKVEQWILGSSETSIGVFPESKHRVMFGRCSSKEGGLAARGGTSSANFSVSWCESNFSFVRYKFS